MSGISTHVLDTTVGLPADGVAISLDHLGSDNKWETLHSDATDADGRCSQLMPQGRQLIAGIYRVRFDTGSYYDSRSIQGLYPFVEITFTVRTGDDHLHIPLLLTANGYTTYRGS